MVYPDNVNIVDVISSLPGIINVSSNWPFDYNDYKLDMFFNIKNDNNRGLYLLTRCTDRRYWQYGHLWNISLSVGDLYENDVLPITYNLHCDETNEKFVRNQSKNLIRNMNEHLEHYAFMEGFNLNKKEFEISFISYMRKKKLREVEFINNYNSL